MKFSAFVLALVAFAPSAAFAQTTAPAPSPHAMHGMRGDTHGDMHAHMKQFEAFRLQVLHALTTANRALLASVVGQLAVADKPDHRAAAAKLDAALSSSEKSAILDAHSKMAAAMEAAHPDESPGPMHAMGTPSAGMILLMVAGGHGPMGHGPRR